MAAGTFGEPPVKALAHARDQVLQELDLSGQLFRAPLGVKGDGLEDLADPGVDLLDLSDQQAMGVAKGLDLLAQGRLAEDAGDQAMEGEAEAGAPASPATPEPQPRPLR